jgi:hypothetical protein
LPNEGKSQRATAPTFLFFARPSDCIGRTGRIGPVGSVIFLRAIYMLFVGSRLPGQSSGQAKIETPIWPIVLAKGLQRAISS